MAKKKSKKNQKNFIQRSKLFLRRIYDFFVQDDTKLKIECKTEVWSDTINNRIRIRRSFYTFRSLRYFAWWYVTKNPYEKAKKLLGEFEQNPAYALRFAGAFSVFLLISFLDFKNISNVTLVAGAIAFDATTNRTSETGSSTTFSHTTSGSNRALTVSFSSYRGASSCTYSGTSMSLGTSASQGSAKSGVYYLASPASGANNVVFTPSSGGCDHICAISFTGADSSPLGVVGTNVGTNSDTISKSVTTTQANSFLVDAMSTEEDPAHTYGADAGQTQRMWGQLGYWVGGGASTKPTTSTGSYTMGWTKSSGSQANNLSISVIEIKELGAVSVTVSATVVSATFSVPSRTVTGGATISPSAQVITASIPSYTVTAIRNNTETPSAKALTFSIPAYSVSASANVAPSVQSLSFSIPTYTVEAGNIQANPATQSMTFSIPSYAVDVIANISVSPSAKVLTFSIPSYSVSFEANTTVTPSAQILTASIPTYTISVEANISVSAGVQAMTFSIPSYSPSGSAIVSPSVKTLTFSIPSYTITNIANITILPEVFSLSLSIPTYSVAGDYWQNKFSTPATSWSDKY